MMPGWCVEARLLRANVHIEQSKMGQSYQMKSESTLGGTPALVMLASSHPDKSSLAAWPSPIGFRKS